jgi:tetratricopeptide (TPR) repeat protein
LTRSLFSAIFLLALVVQSRAAEQAQLDASPSLFTVMAAINAAGYDAGLNSAANNPLREQMRRRLGGSEIPALAEIRQFVAAHHQKDPTAELSQYVSFALSVKGPPDFAWKFARSIDIPPDVVPIKELQPLIERFYHEANIAELWKEAQPAFEQAIARYHEPVSQAVLEVNSYLRNPTAGYLGRRFQIYVDLLGAPNQVQTRSYADDYYVVVTPSLELRVNDIRHAYLHYLLDPLGIKYGMEILKKRALGDYAQAAPALDESLKSDFVALTTESFIKAIETRMPGNKPSVNDALREGYILAPYFAESLPLYEKQEQAMRLYFPEMVKRIDGKAEARRLANVEFAAAPRARPVKTAAPEPVPVLSGVYKTLEDAEEAYGNRDLEKAKAGYLRALQETSEKPLHAKAYYGMARIAVLQKDPELAERLFAKALDSSPDPQARAWILVYLGRLSDVAGDRQQAAKHYQEALAVTGASVAARKAAEQGMQQTFKKQEN